MATKSVLEVTSHIKVTTADKFDPAAFFVKRDGLYVFNDFTERIVSKAKKMKAAVEFPLVASDLTKPANDEAIESELPKEHIFSETDVCAIIASLIEMQPKGEKGILATDYNWNLFYTPAFVVFVVWGGGVWRVGAWERGDGAWGAGGRVFSPATEA